MAVIEKDFKIKIEALQKDVESAQNDKQLISKSYESQLQMMSEHLVELQTGASTPGPRGSAGGNTPGGGGKTPGN